MSMSKQSMALGITRATSPLRAMFSTPEEREKMPGKTKVELMHVSYMPGAEGRVGQVIEVDSTLAEQWCADGSAKPAPKEVVKAQEPAVAAQKPKPKVAKEHE